MQTNFRMIAGVSALGLVMAAAAPAQARHPDLTGTWILDPAHSDGAALPTAATYTIIQHGDTITMDQQTTSEMGTVTTHMVLGLDGKAWKNNVTGPAGPFELSSTGGWAHDTAAFLSTGTIQGADLVELDRVVPGADGKSFTMLRSGSAGGQDIPLVTLFFNKKP
ncbi:MAG TPA: hypothetical protein VGL65_00760 [Gemmatimonadales bacterium]|jgi:hypothetical protein